MPIAVSKGVNEDVLSNPDVSVSQSTPSDSAISVSPPITIQTVTKDIISKTNFNYYYVIISIQANYINYSDSTVSNVNTISDLECVVSLSDYQYHLLYNILQMTILDNYSGPEYNRFMFSKYLSLIPDNGYTLYMFDTFRIADPELFLKQDYAILPNPGSYSISSQQTFNTIGTDEITNGYFISITDVNNKKVSAVVKDVSGLIVNFDDVILSDNYNDKLFELLKPSYTVSVVQSSYSGFGIDEDYMTWILTFGKCFEINEYITDTQVDNSNVVFVHNMDFELSDNVGNKGLMVEITYNLGERKDLKCVVGVGNIPADGLYYSEVFNMWYKFKLTGLVWKEGYLEDGYLRKILNVGKKDIDSSVGYSGITYSFVESLDDVTVIWHGTDDILDKRTIGVSDDVNSFIICELKDIDVGDAVDWVLVKVGLFDSDYSCIYCVVPRGYLGGLVVSNIVYCRKLGSLIQILSIGSIGEMNGKGFDGYVRMVNGFVFGK